MQIVKGFLQVLLIANFVQLCVIFHINIVFDYDYNTYFEFAI